MLLLSPFRFWDKRLSWIQYNKIKENITRHLPPMPWAHTRSLTWGWFFHWFLWSSSTRNQISKYRYSLVWARRRGSRAGTEGRCSNISPGSWRWPRRTPLSSCSCPSRCLPLTPVCTESRKWCPAGFYCRSCFCAANSPPSSGPRRRPGYPLQWSCRCSNSWWPCYYARLRLLFPFCVWLASEGRLVV